jgi:type IV pilus assembly protein PilW
MNTYQRRQRGFSLVSTMVGLTIGLIVATTAMSTASFMEAQKRLAIGSNSVLVNGGLGLGRIENEVRMAGLGLMSRQDFACSRFNVNYQGSVRLDNEALYPASIVAGGAEPDTVSVAYLDSLTSAAYAQLLLPMATMDAEVKVAMAPDAAVGSVLLLQDTAGTSPCTVRDVTARTTTGFGTSLAIAGGAYRGAGFSAPVVYSEGAHVNASRRFVWSTFRIRNNTLEEVDNLTDEATVIADGVIGMKAQYGITNGSASTVASWVDADGSFAAPTNGDMARVRALRVGFVVRSMEKDTSCAGKTATFSYWPNGPALDVTGATDWKCYSYRTFNVIIPLVNVVMGLK